MKMLNVSGLRSEHYINAERQAHPNRINLWERRCDAARGDVLAQRLVMLVLHGPAPLYRSIARQPAIHDPYGPYWMLRKEISDTLDAGVSLTFADLNFEAQELLRAAHPDGDYPIPDLSAEEA